MMKGPHLLLPLSAVLLLAASSPAAPALSLRVVPRVGATPATIEVYTTWRRAPTQSMLYTEADNGEEFHQSASPLREAQHEGYVKFRLSSPGAYAISSAVLAPDGTVLRMAHTEALFN